MTPRRWILPLAAAAGAGIAIIAVVLDSRPRERGAAAGDQAESLAARAPFAHAVAGSGIVEAGTGNIAVGTPVAGIVAAVDVHWGQSVDRGTVLFRIDDRDLRAELPVATARVQQAEARLARTRYESQLADRLHDQHVLSDEQYRTRHFDVRIDATAMAAARAELARIRAEMDRRIVRAPVAGRVLQLNTRPGEFAEAGALVPPLMLLGDDSRLRVRVDIDQNDAARIAPFAPAIAIVRGRPDLRVDLEFESIEPYVAPKAVLTGRATERVDTRVLQVIYSFARTRFPVYVGQNLDVYIEDVRAPSAARSR